MLSDSVKSDIQTAYSEFLKSGDLKARRSQREMIALIANTLADQQRETPICVVEAGTGTGKTLAYLVAALPIAQAQGKQLIVSTATINLQEQLIHKDLPDLQKRSSLNFNYSLIKGRGRYLCNAKLERLMMGGTQDEMPWHSQDEVKTFTADALQLYQRFEVALREQQWDGDRDQWPEIIDESQWRPVTSDRYQCTGRQCPHVSQCAFFRAREELQNIDLLVANHDIVLSDLSLGGGAILPDPQESIYIFDEGHHLAEKTRNHFSNRCRIQSALNLLSQMDKQLDRLSKDINLKAIPTLTAETRTGNLQLVELLQPLNIELHEYFQENVREFSRDLRFSHGDLPSFLKEAALTISPVYQRLISTLDSLKTELEPSTDADDPKRAIGPLCEYWYGVVGQWLGFIEGQYNLWQNYQLDSKTGQEHNRFARWITYYENDKDYECVAAPIIAAEALHENLWKRCSSAVLTSATLTALGSFQQIKMLAGIPEDAVYQCLPSPFNFSEKATINLFKHHVNPKDSLEHTQLLIDQLPKHLKKEAGNLVLFSSERQMNDVFDGLPSEWKAQIFLQGTYSKLKIIEQHKSCIDDGKGSTIFGLASFAEGVDLPGDYCTHVVIAKIPFAAPDNPVDEALSEWIEAQGGNAFGKVSLPTASLRLIQATGRLLRSDNDSGQITIFDQRLLNSGYGKQLLRALPPFRQQVVELL